MRLNDFACPIHFAFFLRNGVGKHDHWKCEVRGSYQGTTLVVLKRC